MIAAVHVFFSFDLINLCFAILLNINFLKRFVAHHNNLPGFDFCYSYNLLPVYNLGYDFIVVNNISYMKNSVIFNIKTWDILLIFINP